MNFCEECNNVLYPREKREEKALYYVCRRCPFEKKATSNLVYVHDLRAQGDATAEFMASNKEITLDPTLPRTHDIPCEKCGQNEVVFFAPSEENMQLMYYCCNRNCGHSWNQKT